MGERKWQQRITLFLGIFLSFGMVAGLVLPLIQANLTQPQVQVQPTATPRPTVPAPPDTASINFDETYLHPSGLFTAAIPTGWQPSGEFNTTGEAQVSMQNPNALSVLEMRIIRPTDQISLESPEDFAALFDSNWLSASWRQYSTWNEDARRVDGERLVMDFSLQRSGQDFIARQIAFTDGTWIYTVRAVTPSNANELLRYLLENEIETFEPVDRFVGAPIEWNAYYDEATALMIRYPGTWQLTDSATGGPASINGDNVQLLVETERVAIDSADAAAEYIAGLRSGTTVESVEEIEQFGVSGYRVAYTVPTLDGPTDGGIALLLTPEENVVHVANALIAGLSADEVSAEGDEIPAIVSTVRDTLGSVSLLPELASAD